MTPPYPFVSRGKRPSLLILLPLAAAACAVASGESDALDTASSSSTTTNATVGAAGTGSSSSAMTTGGPAGAGGDATTGGSTTTGGWGGAPTISSTGSSTASSGGSAPQMGGESCASPVDLTTASQALGGGAYSLMSAFGNSDDLNPLDTSGKAPGCSLVYDAVGHDVVFSITLAPGQTLDMTLTATPMNAAGAIYVLDDCGAMTWPDFDQSGACGNNEYATHGYCGIGGCAPLDFAFTHPTMLDGVATQTKTYFVVIDQVGAADATSFTLDWSLLN